MIEGRPSMTAQRVAMRRAAHQLIDNPRVFEDALAVRILGPEIAAALKAEPENELERRLRAFMVVRSRYAEEQLATAVSRGVKQYVVLGAGLDTFAYRNPYPDVLVFEIDYPATQGWKRQRLEAGSIPIPASLRFAPVDFDKQTIEQGLASAGFAAAEPGFFSWLGVTPYLTPETVFSTLRLILAMNPSNGVVFDYAVPRSSLDAFEQAALDAILKRVAAAGEPFRGFFAPEELARELRAMGYETIEDLDGEEINRRYFANRVDRLVVGRTAHLLCAGSA